MLTPVDIISGTNGPVLLAEGFSVSTGVEGKWLTVSLTGTSAVELREKEGPRERQRRGEEGGERLGSRTADVETMMFWLYRWQHYTSVRPVRHD